VKATPAKVLNGLDSFPDVVQVIKQGCSTSQCLSLGAIIADPGLGELPDKATWRAASAPRWTRCAAKNSTPSL